MFASSPLEDRSFLRTHRFTYGCLWVEESYLNFPGKFQCYMYSRIVRMMKNTTHYSEKLPWHYTEVTSKSPPKIPHRPKKFSGNIKIRFLHKILSLIKLVPLISPGGARGPLLATRLMRSLFFPYCFPVINISPIITYKCIRTIDNTHSMQDMGKILERKKNTD